MIGGKAYHRYFDGYSERKVWDEKKKKYKMESYYSEDYYQAQIPPDEVKKVKKEYLIGYVCATVILIVACSRRTISAALGITAFPTLAIILGLLWQVPSLVSYLQMPELMVKRQFRERVNFMSLSMGLAFLCWVCIVTHVICMVMYGSLDNWLEWFTLAGLLLDSGIFYWVYHREKGIVYLLVPNEAKIPDDCYDITFRDQEVE